jgi:hypothetical protein
MANRTHHTTESYVELVRSIHKGRFDYSKIVLIAMNRPITVGCPEHGDFTITAKNFSKQGADCPECRERARYIRKEDFIRKSIERYGEGAFDYSRIPDKFMQSDRLRFICTKHGEFKQSAKLHLEACSHSCRKCMLWQRGTTPPKRNAGKKGDTVASDIRVSDAVQSVKLTHLNAWKPPQRST